MRQAQEAPGKIKGLKQGRKIGAAGSSEKGSDQGSGEEATEIRKAIWTEGEIAAEKKKIQRALENPPEECYT